MKYIKAIFPFTLIFLTLILLSGCKKDDGVTNGNTPSTDISATTDAAYAVAANVAIDNGGTLGRNVRYS